MGIQQTKYLLKHVLNTIKVYRQTLKGSERPTLESEGPSRWTHNGLRFRLKQHIIIICTPSPSPLVSLDSAPWDSAAHSWEDRCKSREDWRRRWRQPSKKKKNSKIKPQTAVRGTDPCQWRNKSCFSIKPTARWRQCLLPSSKWGRHPSSCYLLFLLLALGMWECLELSVIHSLVMSYEEAPSTTLVSSGTDPSCPERTETLRSLLLGATGRSLWEASVQETDPLCSYCFSLFFSITFAQTF